jgi:hypothetical protein
MSGIIALPLLSAATQNADLKIGDVKVILCGESVKAFEWKNPLLEKALQNEKMSIMACGL